MSDGLKKGKKSKEKDNTKESKSREKSKEGKAIKKKNSYR
jgi:hypothetical protein